ncbi:hypothetical protein MPTK1_1g18490 [Marchantia polymorpha subsp. ruderalis]|uniref:Uncharacterized protein n=2 Tax=Marchantia polymorpha TaxID=3197 RepID=A0AAF6ARK3_MARPO|nr:hypothetical protein MARPO_0001s0187 [Marchantia polymorpha]BBM99073.1 hypothetical protein Mp_1g18490 [Marchantia polymorpha subsp. ruderalis]|eukprot:PTQ50150.1 hypothetical protein MARPO_0001s0187 [Marchantia polymorpha]
MKRILIEITNPAIFAGFQRLVMRRLDTPFIPFRNSKGDVSAAFNIFTIPRSLLSQESLWST